MADNFDRFFPDWTTGMLTIASGSKSFTATNARLQLAPIRSGDTIITPSGLTLIIDTINANGNGGTLFFPAPVAAAGTFQTCIRFQSDNSRYTGAVAALVKAATGGNLMSLAALQGKADAMPFFSGAGVFSIADLTAFARLLLAQSNSSDVYARLGVVPNAQIPDRLREISPTKPDANQMLEFGCYAVVGTEANLPNTTAAFIIPMMRNSLYGRQIWYQRDGASIMTRNFTNGVWSSWVDNSPPIVIENANGRAIRDADGTQICFKSKHPLIFGSATILQAFWNYPAAFVAGSIPAVTATPQSMANISSAGQARIVTTTNNSNGTVLMRVNGSGFVSADTIEIDCCAFGRWK